MAKQGVKKSNKGCVCQSPQPIKAFFLEALARQFCETMGRQDGCFYWYDKPMLDGKYYVYKGD